MTAGPAAAPTAATPAAGAHNPELIKPAIGPCRSDGQLSFNIRSSQANLCNPSIKGIKFVDLLFYKQVFFNLRSSKQRKSNLLTVI